MYLPPASSGSSTFLRRNILATVVLLVQRAWAEVKSSGAVTSDTGEVPIAGALYREMWRQKKKMNLTGPPLIIDEGATRSNEALLCPDGFIDLKLFYSFNEDDFFGIECKRVSATSRRLASEYVENGMMRFITGKYCMGHDYAALLGFVIDNKVGGSLGLIRGKMEASRTTLRTSRRLRKASLLPEYRGIYDSRHYQQVPDIQIELLHILLPFE